VSEPGAKRDPVRADIRALAPNGIGLISRRGAGRAGLIPLWFGESDLVTPDFIRAATKRALDEGQTFYAPARGLPRLREGIRDWMARRAGARVDLERVTVPGSAMLAISLAVQCLARTGDEVVVISPMWPNIFQAIEVAGAVPRLVALRRAGKGPWRLDMNALVAALGPRTKAVFFASPSNPTGWIMSFDEQRTLLDECRKRGVGIIADEVYGPIVFDGTHAPTFASLADPDDAVFVVHSFSKAWAMTGWRIGWMIHPASLADPISAMTVAANTGAASFVQAGAIAAIEQGDAFVDGLRDRCRENLDQLDAFIARHPRLSWAAPPGGFYGFVAIDGMRDSMAFAEHLLDVANVGVAPGMAFGAPGDAVNERHIRICIAYDPGRFAQALERFAAAL
jgi:aspartate/methionine/tyrosine aminotransferase